MLFDLSMVVFFNCGEIDQIKMEMILDRAGQYPINTQVWHQESGLAILNISKPDHTMDLLGLMEISFKIPQDA